PGGCPRGRTFGRTVRRRAGRGGAAPPAHRPGVVGRIRGLPPGATPRRLGVGVRPGGEFDPRGRATPAPALRRGPDPSEGRNLPGPCVRLRREGRHASTAAVSTGPAAPGRVFAGRNPAQERLLRSLRRRQGLKASDAPPRENRPCTTTSRPSPTPRS